MKELNIGERIKMIRDDNNMTMQAFGERIASDSAAVSRIEKNQRKATAKTIKLICKEFNINEDWLINGEGEMYNKPKSDEVGYMRLLAEIAAIKDEEVRKLLEKAVQLNEDDLKALLFLADHFLKNNKKEDSE